MRRLDDDARAIFDAAVRAVQPPALVTALDLGALVGDVRRVLVVGAGKASVPFGGAVEAELGERGEGLVVVPTGYPATVPDGMPRPSRIRVVEGGHPVPTAASARAAAEALALAGSAGPDDLVLALISGGGSALWALPPDGLSLADVQATTRLLLASGAPIGAMNAVRKHLSRIAGGRLAVAAHPARLVALVLSDVPGDDPSTIASGPTVPDPTTFGDALAVLDEFALRDAVPSSVRTHLEAGARGEVEETPPPGHPALARAETRLIGTNAVARNAAAAEAVRLGYAVADADGALSGEARDQGRALAEAAGSLSPRSCRVWGGETTVTVTGAGTGGRNQEAALAAALVLEGSPADVAVLCGGTDGVDGPTDAAGGIATSATADAIRRAGLDPDARLADNDAHAALAAAGALLRTGPTHTNVADLAVALRR